MDERAGVRMMSHLAQPRCGDKKGDKKRQSLVPAVLCSPSQNSGDGAALCGTGQEDLSQAGAALSLSLAHHLPHQAVLENAVSSAQSQGALPVSGLFRTARTVLRSVGLE